MTPMVSATIDTAALRHNLHAVRDCAPRSRVMAVIKANAYGHGLVAVARALDRPMHSRLRVSTKGSRCAGRASKARPCCSKACSIAGSSTAAASAGFELVVHMPEQIELLRQAGAGEPFRIWLKLDSGMNRLGFKGAAFDAALEALSALPRVQSPVNLFTHLASADDPDCPTTTSSLRASRRRLRRSAASAASPIPPALLSFPKAQADWVRPGLLLYGVSPFAGSIGADYGLSRS